MPWPCPRSYIPEDQYTLIEKLVTQAIVLYTSFITVRQAPAQQQGQAWATLPASCVCSCQTHPACALCVQTYPAAYYTYLSRVVLVRG